MADAHHHRASTGLKQKHKSHKGSQSHRGAKRAKGAGRVERVGPGKKAGNPAGAKEKRQQRAKQLRQAKRDEVTKANRSVHRGGDAPVVVAVVPLCSDCDGSDVADGLGDGFHARRVGHGDVAGALDAAAGADVVVFVMAPRVIDPEAEEEDDEEDEDDAMAGVGRADCRSVKSRATLGLARMEGCSPEAADVLAALKALGLPSVLGALARGEGGEKGSAARKRESLARRFFGSEFGDPVPWVADRGQGEVAGALRAAAAKCPKWRSARARVAVTAAAFDAPSEALQVEGWVKDARLSAGRLLHVRGLGAAKIASVEVFASRADAARGRPPLRTLVGDCSEPLEAAAAGDDLANGEQTWPTREEEAAEAAARARARKGAKPTDADYFKAWDVRESDDEDDDGDDDGDDDDDEDVMMDQAGKLEAYDEDLEFPDEVDVGEDVEARDRFARYRALQSFSQSDWDCYDSLPRTYARVNALANFEAARKRALQACDNDDDDSCAPVGAYVRAILHVKAGDAARAAAAAAELNAAPSPGGATTLLAHENRLTVAHFLVKRVFFGGGKDEALDDLDPLKSKERLVVRCGHRTWTTRPIFSQHALKGAKAKFERFLRPGDHFVASVFGPVTFAPCPAFFFRETSGDLVAVGHCLDCDPNRITLKKVVLTGLPARTHKRKAVVKHMFYNPDDVAYFKPATLTTKHGLTCHITEPIGTHGHFKVALSRPMKQNDTILLNLYKRVYPKFPGGDDDDAPLLVA